MPRSNRPRIKGEKAAVARFYSIESGWEAFRRNALSDLTPPRILAGMKGSFFAGVQTTLTLLQEIDQEHFSDDEKRKRVERIFQDCQQYFQRAATAGEGALANDKAERREAEGEGPASAEPTWDAAPVQDVGQHEAEDQGRDP